MDFNWLKLKIQNSISGNASRKITGFSLQEVLLLIVDVLGEAISEGSNDDFTLVLDDEMSDTSENGVKNKIIKAYADLHSRYRVIDETEAPDLPGGSNTIILDDEMSDTSENGVKNRVIKAYVDDRHNELAFLKDMFYWEDEAHTIIGTKYPFFSESTVTAGGKKTNGDSESSSITITDVENYLTENNYATKHWVEEQKYATKEALKDLSNKVDGLPGTDVDLKRYATEQWVKAQGYVTSTSLEPILSKIDTRLKALEKLLDWFEFDEAAQMIKAKFGIYSVGAITAAKKKEEE